MKKLIYLTIIILLSGCCIIEDICYSLEYPENSEFNPAFTNDTVYYAYDNFIELVFEYREHCINDSVIIHESQVIVNDTMYTKYFKVLQKPTFDGFIEWYIDNHRNKTNLGRY